MNPLNRQLFYLPFRKRLKTSVPEDRAEKIWAEAGREYARILSQKPQLRKHPGAMVIPAVALYRTLSSYGLDAESMLNEYGNAMGKSFARFIHGLTSIPKADRLVWNSVDKIMKFMSSEKLGYKRRLVSDPPGMYGVDILSCPYHELARELNEEKAVLCICHMDKEYSKGFHHIRYERHSAVSEGAEACAYRLTFDPGKE